ncbi:hypothetical protein NDU88_004641 [Pleurodeles waltl]|uniref:Uncharacterized protein n=1 Tax=Pleurodeles waltl TaxID=8319 RepID=A0AAV7M6V8_PLEWA|nr:hypothetical protein NDU88_004641 [Pleurodeles waltl]
MRARSTAAAKRQVILQRGQLTARRHSVEGVWSSMEAALRPAPARRHASPPPYRSVLRLLSPLQQMGNHCWVCSCAARREEGAASSLGTQDVTDSASLSQGRMPSL